ncbi:MAG: flagellar hook-basal body protein [Planctomycetes bacterium]|nr:flagellar hook-basal body protein [Planctomycetota bacterium]
MIYGLYQSAAGMMTHEFRQDVIANNLANAETVGFKREIASIAERKPATEAGVRRGPSDRLLDVLSGGSWLGRTETDFSPGAFQLTSNPTDVAIVGAGFLRVSSGGQELLTRDGRMMTDAEGTLVATSDGAPMLSEAGLPIRVNPRGGPVSIDETGAVSQNNAVVGRLSVVDVANAAALRKAGAGRYTLGDQEPVPSAARLWSNHVEQSGVQPIFELTGMLEASRAYQLNAQMLTLQDQTAARLINAVAT